MRVSMTAASVAFAVAIGAVAAGHSRVALACGGCFVPPPPPTQPNDPGTVVAAHRMLLSVSPDQTILWDQIQYTGAPTEFAWVLPVKPGARIELGSDALFDVLDAATSPSVRPPRLRCNVFPEAECSVSAVRASTFGCSAEDASGDDAVTPIPGILPPDPVHVVSRGSAGPYETVILHSEEPDALPKWLNKHGYKIPADIEPLIATYVAEGFDFAALRLLPSAGVQQMRPIRVVLPGAVTSLPLRMVAAGTGARTSITLFVMGEGRYAPQNFAEVRPTWPQLSWDFASASSNYASLRAGVLDPGKEFYVSYAQRDPLFGEVIDPSVGFAQRYQTTEGWTYTRIAEAYVRQALINGETSSVDCADALLDLQGDDRRVVRPACSDAGDCAPVDPMTEIDARELDCDAPIGSDVPLDDLSQALLGMHPKDVWVTRMEANLTRESLAADLVLQPATSQVAVSGLVQATAATNLPDTCEIIRKGDDAAGIPVLGRSSGLRRLGDLAAALAVGGFALLLVLRRRWLARVRPAMARRGAS